MSAKAVSEYTGKELLYRSLNHISALAKPVAVELDEHTNFDEAVSNCEWLKTSGVSCYHFRLFRQYIPPSPIMPCHFRE